MIRRPSAASSSSATSASSANMWLISFSDLISLMLSFFVLMYAMREPDPQRWAQMAGTVTAPSMASRPSDEAPDPHAAYNAASVEEVSPVNLDYLAVVLRNQFGNRPEMAGVRVVRQEDRLVLALPDDRWFAGNGLALSDEGRRALFLLAPTLGRVGNRIDVVGRVPPPAGADKVGPLTADVAWERALMRALSIAGGLRAAGYHTDLVGRAAVADMQRGETAGVDLTIREQEGRR